MYRLIFVFSLPLTVALALSSSWALAEDQPENVPANWNEQRAANLKSTSKPAPAEWEKDAAVWALKTWQTAMDRNREQADKVIAAFKSKKPADLPAEIRTANQKHGFVLFARPYQLPVLRKESPTLEECKFESVFLQAAKDEWVALQVGVWSLQDLETFSFEVTDLTHENGKDILQASKSAKLYYTFNLWTKIIKKKNQATPDDDVLVGQQTEFENIFADTPVVLLKRDRVAIPANEAQALFLDLYIPTDAIPGTYTGSLRFKSNLGTAILPVRLQVRPFVLDPCPESGRGPFASNFMDQKELLQLREHGCNIMTWWTSAGYTVNLKDGKIEADFKPYKQYLKLLDDCGFVGPHAVFLGGSDPKIANRMYEILQRPVIQDARNKAQGKAFRDADNSPPFGDYLCQTLKQFHQQMTAAGHPDLAACLMDEPDHEPRPDRGDWYIKTFALVEKGAPEVPLYGTFYHEGDEDRLSHHHRMWTTNRPQKKIADLCHKAGARLHTYGGGPRYNRSNVEFRFSFGIVPWIFDAEASYFWAQYWHRGEPFDPFAQTDFSTASLPTPHGPIATTGLKIMRQAIDDRRYLLMLEKLVQKAKVSADPNIQQAAARHEAFIRPFKNSMQKLGVRGGAPNFESNNEETGKVGSVTITNLKGEKFVLNQEASTWAFCEFFQNDVAERIQKLQALMNSSSDLPAIKAEEK